MDNDLFDFSVFNSKTSFQDYLLQSTSSNTNGAQEGTGMKCELAEYDSMYNAAGTQVLLRSGTKYALGSDISMSTGGDTESAIVRTTFWNKSGVQSNVEISVRSSYMKTALKAIVPQYKDKNFRFNHISFTDKPKFLFHFREDIFNYAKRLEHGSDEQRHVFLLLEFLMQELADAISAYFHNVEMVDSPSIDFHHLWTIFREGEVVYLAETIAPDRVETILRYESLQTPHRCFGTPCTHEYSWKLCGTYLDTDGTNLIDKGVIVTIPYFHGYQDVKRLPVLPLRFHPLQDALRTRLVARGRKFVNLIGRHHRYFKGLARLHWGDQDSNFLEVPPMPDLVPVSVDGRIMVDPEKLLVAGLTYPKSLISLNFGLTDEQYLICRGHVGGFSFSESKWGFFDVRQIEPVAYDQNAFSSYLVLESRHKKTLLSLIQMHSNKFSNSFDDLIKGKGNGLVFLLHGEPGVGKTMTAESIADRSKRPLLKIDASSLYNSAGSLEKGLKKALHLAERWEAVALLDEADIFLERRSQVYMQRNCFVTVFLRILEYYQGILFLTTNRINSFDRVLKSRIQVAIYYPPMNYSSRQHLWKIFLSKALRPHQQRQDWTTISTAMASEELNGREIRDVVRIAQASAYGDGSVIQIRHLRDALDGLKKFDEEFEKDREINNELRKYRRVAERKRLRMELFGEDGAEEGDLAPCYS